MNKSNPLSLRARAEAAGIPYKTVFTRIKRGWSAEKALSIPKDSPEKPKIVTQKKLTIETIKSMIPKPRISQDAFEVCYGCKFVPGPQSPPWVYIKPKPHADTDVDSPKS